MAERYGDTTESWLTMCNARNHPASCRCGFGGEGHAGHASARPGSHQFLGVPCILPTYESYVNPNAKCPVCRAPVFFYQSPDGGRVFFDELGPPWPKHPCTDRRSVPETMDPSSIPPIEVMPTWERQGWMPFFIAGVTDRDRRVYEIRGKFGDFSLTIFVRKKSDVYLTSLSDFTTNTISFLKRNGDELYELSLISRSGVPTMVRAFSRMSVAYEDSRIKASRAGQQSKKSQQMPKSNDICVGTVKWFNTIRGYGFISPDDDGEEVFLHASALERSRVSEIYEGQRVRAVVGTGRKGKEARIIEIL